MYGLISLPFHEAVPLPPSIAAFAAFVALMLACSISKDRVIPAWRARHGTPVGAGKGA